jgi:hypothetical protein
MLREAQKFADLDMMGQAVLDEGDRSLFEEALQCYQIGSHRAAVILTWCATADCLNRRVRDLAGEGDSQAQQAQTDLQAFEGQAVYEGKLIAWARKCELIDDFEERSLLFARDVRSKCAHPTGVLPSAEAVRHIFHICIHSVLSRTGYHGIAFVQDVVTVQFDDRHLLPNENKASDYCRDIALKVPQRSWPQFATLAAQLRPGPHSEIWEKNALSFFRVLLSLSDDATARRIAGGFQGFEAKSADFFSVLVGIDHRVEKFWDAQKRAQARARLTTLSVMKITPEHVHSWAVICTADGLEEADTELLRQKWGIMSRHLATEDEFLQKHRADLMRQLKEMLLDEAASSQALVAIGRLAGSRLCDERSESMQVIIKTIIERFVRGSGYRELLDNVATWTGPMLITLLEESELFLQECSNDNPDDSLYLIDVARELAHRSPSEIPQKFEEVVNRLLRKELLPDWAEEESEVGAAFRSQLAILLQQQQSAFPGIDVALAVKVTVAGEEEKTIEAEDEKTNEEAEDENSPGDAVGEYVAEVVTEEKVIEAPDELAIDGKNQ